MVKFFLRRVTQTGKCNVDFQNAFFVSLKKIIERNRDVLRIRAEKMSNAPIKADLPALFAPTNAV